jgi:hypothetical protein
MSPMFLIILGIIMILVLYFAWNWWIFMGIAVFLIILGIIWIIIRVAMTVETGGMIMV